VSVESGCMHERWREAMQNRRRHSERADPDTHTP
jgi:hypothetical protein